MRLILKKGDDNDPTNYRGIALLNTPAKIFTSLLLDRLVSWSEQPGAKHVAQSRFRPGRGWKDITVVLSSTIDLQLSRKKDNYIGSLLILEEHLTR